MPADAIVWREWDGEYVVRNERSGSTHLLGPLAGRILRILLEESKALAVDDLVAKLGSEFPEDAATERRVAIAQVLAEFQRIGLAEPVAQ